MTTMMHIAKPDDKGVAETRRTRSSGSTRPALHGGGYAAAALTGPAQQAYFFLRFPDIRPCADRARRTPRPLDPASPARNRQGGAHPLTPIPSPHARRVLPASPPRRDPRPARPRSRRPERLRRHGDGVQGAPRPRPRLWHRRVRTAARTPGDRRDRRRPGLAHLDVARAEPGAERGRWIHGDATTLPPEPLEFWVQTVPPLEAGRPDRRWGGAPALRGV